MDILNSPASGRVLADRPAPEPGPAAAKAIAEAACLRSYKAERTLALANAHSSKTDALHPLEIVRELAKVITPDVTTCLDMGAFHIWMERYLLSFRARQMLVSNGQQTMGVGLPRGIAASIVNPSQKVVSISGDGGFMMSSMELETAVRLKCNLVHVVWVDQGYNMVEFQEQNKYGRGSGVDFGPIDFARYAQACGAKGAAVTSPAGLGSALRQAMEVEGPVVISVPVDYSQNHLLMEPRTTFGTVSTAA
jgi:acetolactate synthase-1/2/3 large subunit